MHNESVFILIQSVLYHRDLQDLGRVWGKKTIKTLIKISFSSLPIDQNDVNIIFSSNAPKHLGQPNL